MKNLLMDIITFFKTLTLIDYVLFLAILVLLVLIVSLIYLLQTTDIEEYEPEEDNGEFDIKKAVEEIESASPREIEINEYEREQEENAIISYEELLSNTRKNKINYETDEMINDKVSVKKFDLDNLVSEDPEMAPELNARVISYAHEEAFLEALKKLQQLLD